VALQVVFVNSFRRVVRSVVHQALDFGEGRERGAFASIDVVRVERAEENHRSSWVGEGASGGGDLPVLELISQGRPVGLLPAWAGFIILVEGGGMEIKTGAWSDPVDRRDDASQVWKAGNIFGLANPRAMVLRLWVPVKGNRV